MNCFEILAVDATRIEGRKKTFLASIDDGNNVREIILQIEVLCVVKFR